MSTTATTPAPLRKRPAWAALGSHYEAIRELHMRELFAQDPQRGERLTVQGAGLYLDYSKNRITDETVRLLLELAQQSQLAERIEDMFTGKRINVSENRSVLHVALRMPATSSLVFEGRMWSRRFRPCWSGCQSSLSVYGRGSGLATPDGQFATSSTSASAARTSGR